MPATFDFFGALELSSRFPLAVLFRTVFKKSKVFIDSFFFEKEREKMLSKVVKISRQRGAKGGKVTSAWTSAAKNGDLEKKTDDFLVVFRFWSL